MTTAPATTTAVLLEALGHGIPGDRLIVDDDVLASLSHDEAEWAAVGRAAVGLRPRSEAECSMPSPVCAELGVAVVAAAPVPGSRRSQRHRRLRDRRPRRGWTKIVEMDVENLFGGRPAGSGEQRPEGGSCRARPLVSARPRECADIDDRRQRGDQRGRPVLPEVRRHA